MDGADQALGTYLESLASAAPTPGGGSAAAVAVELAAALIAMVAKITADAKRFEHEHARAAEIATAADALRTKLEAARVADERAYAHVAVALKLPKATEDEQRIRKATLQDALTAAAEAPLAIARLAEQTALLCERAVELRNTNLATDLACAALFLKAATHAAALNVRVNHKFIQGEASKESQIAELSRIESNTTAVSDRVIAEVSRLL